jgi:hypothetical protein
MSGQLLHLTRVMPPLGKRGASGFPGLPRSLRGHSNERTEETD